MKAQVIVTLDAEDAAIIGKTLQALATTNRSPDLEVAARLRRVGEKLWQASAPKLLGTAAAAATTPEASS